MDVIFGKLIHSMIVLNAFSYFRLFQLPHIKLLYQLHGLIYSVYNAEKGSPLMDKSWIGLFLSDD